MHFSDAGTSIGDDGQTYYDPKQHEYVDTWAWSYPYMNEPLRSPPAGTTLPEELFTDSQTPSSYYVDCILGELRFCKSMKIFAKILAKC